MHSAIPSFAPPPLIGSLIANRYRTGHEIGRGATGVVLSAIDEHDGSEVAVKWLYPIGLGVGMAERYVREAQLVSQIQHPNVVRVLAAVAHDEGTWIVMERLNGHSLSQLLLSQGALAPAVALPLFRDVVKGVAAAHALQIIHRDLKPDNVYLAATGAGMVPKVLDFGHGKRLNQGEPSSLTQTGTALGTPSYMAPEQIFESKYVDARADVFALGVLLFQMLTGRVPFAAPTLAALAFAIMRNPPPRLSESCPALDPRVAAMVTRALAGEAKKRYAHAGELLTALNALLP